MKLKVVLALFLVLFSLCPVVCGAFNTDDLLLELKKPIIVRVVNVYEDMIPYKPIIVECEPVHGSGTVGLAIREAYFSNKECRELRALNKNIDGTYSGRFLKKGDLIQVMELEENISEMVVHTVDLTGTYFRVIKCPFRYVTSFKIIKSLKDELLKPEK